MRLLSGFNLFKEMHDAVDVIRNFNQETVTPSAAESMEYGDTFITGGEPFILIDPSEGDGEPLKTLLKEATGLEAIAVSDRKALFPTIEIHSAEGFDCGFQKRASCGLIISAAAELGIDIDNPARKKIGNHV